MMVKAFCLYDSKLEAYLTPFFAPNRGVAMRHFADLVSNPEHAFGKHPEDYTLFELGDFDDVTANFIAGSPASICNGLDLRNRDNGEEEA